MATKHLSKRAKAKLKKKAMVQPTTGNHFKFDDEGSETQVNVLAAPPGILEYFNSSKICFERTDMAPLEYFARIQAGMMEHNTQDRIEVSGIRKQKEYAKRARAAYLLLFRI